MQGFIADIGESQLVHTFSQHHHRPAANKLKAQFLSSLGIHAVAPDVVSQFFTAGGSGDARVNHAVVTAGGLLGHVIFLFQQRHPQIPAGQIPSHGTADYAAANNYHIIVFALQGPALGGGQIFPGLFKPPDLNGVDHSLVALAGGGIPGGNILLPSIDLPLQDYRTPPFPGVNGGQTQLRQFSSH